MAVVGRIGVILKLIDIVNEISALESAKELLRLGSEGSKIYLD
ncbi:hypothetical protein Hanom_Chr17g01543051 [Helianthus anomalus]